MMVAKKAIEVLLVEDNPADVDLTREVLVQNNDHSQFSAVPDGKQAISFLHRRGKFTNVPRPDIIILDLNLPGIEGRHVLQDLMSDHDLSNIPVTVFSSSQMQDDVLSSYRLAANCYFRKPGNLPEFKPVVKAMADIWVPFVSQPAHSRVDKGRQSSHLKMH